MNTSETDGMRVLFSSTSGLGHVLPMVPLAVAFREQDHDVRWATASETRERLEAHGIPTVEAGRRVSERMAEYHQRWPEAQQLPGAEIADHMFSKVFGAVSAPAMLADLRGVVETWRPDVIVHDAADFAAPILARELRVPNVAHSFGSIVPAERVARTATETEPLWTKAGMTMPPYGGCYDHAYIDIHPPSLQVDAMDHIGHIVPLRPEPATAAPDDQLATRIAAALAGAGPVVYITFGTVFTDRPAFPAAVAAASHMDATVVVTVGPNGDPQRFDPLPDNVHVERYIPQSLLLPHCSVVASHAGSGTMLAALAHGLPQLCLPQAADQFRNAAACVSAGAGIALVGHDATKTAITTALHLVLTEGHYRENARQLQAEIAAMPTPDSVINAITQLTHT